jgi:hypothetical protein
VNGSGVGQAADWEVVRHFPPLTLPQLRAQRKVLLSYSLQHPVRQAGAVTGVRHLAVPHAYL